MNEIHTEIQTAKTPCVSIWGCPPGDRYTHPLVQGGVCIYLSGRLATRPETGKEQ